MPNRTDHSVKAKPEDRDLAIKSQAVLIGMIGAVIGALAVMFAGGDTGVWFGALVLTTIIILQIFLWGREKNLWTSVPETATSSVAVRDTMSAPTLPGLALSVSKLGRVRAILGRRDLLPGIREGSEIDRWVGPDDASVSARGGEVANQLTVTRIPSADGEWVLLLPGVDNSPADQNALMERTSFFAGLGHDLKSPLNAVIGFAEIMDGEIRGPMPDAYRDYPALIRESGETLLRLVEDMLAFAKSEAGTYELDVAPIDIAAVGESVLRQSQSVADKAGVRLRFSANGEVIALADAQAVRRIWDNLVSNAIKYSARGDTVTLAAELRGASCVLRVSDTGEGMDADDLAKIAQPFSQGRNSKGRAGTGLGLATVKRLAEMQDGDVEIRTAPGAGTTVSVSFPADRVTEKKAAE